MKDIADANNIKFLFQQQKDDQYIQNQQSSDHYKRKYINFIQFTQIYDEQFQMKSSFKKLDKSSLNQKAYFGHPDLDAIFYNSLSKGHLMVLQQDHPTTNYLSFLRYYVSSNYHSSIPTLIYDTNPNKWKYLISPIKKQDKSQGKNLQKSQIAWRYDKMEIRLSELILSEDVKFLDLTKQINLTNQSLILAIQYPNCSLRQFYRRIQADFINLQDDEKDIRDKKILISTLPSYFHNSCDLKNFLQAIRCMTRSSHVTTLITLPPIISNEVRQTFLLYSDYYLQIGKIGQGYTDFCSSLTILKQIQAGQINVKNRGTTIWGIKNKKKQLRIESLYEQVVEDSLGDENQNKKESIQF